MFNLKHSDSSDTAYLLVFGCFCLQNKLQQFGSITQKCSHLVFDNENYRNIQISLHLRLIETFHCQLGCYLFCP